MTTTDRAVIIAAQDEELTKLAARHGGHITAPQVVAFAKRPTTALHEYFEWDDKIAGPRWRIEQAEKLLRCRLVLLETSDGEPMKVRGFVSLPSEGGYRRLIDVLSNPEQIEELRQDYRARLESLQRQSAAIARLSKDPLYVKVEALLQDEPVAV